MTELALKDLQRKAGDYYQIKKDSIYEKMSWDTGELRGTLAKTIADREVYFEKILKMEREIESLKSQLKARPEKEKFNLDDYKAGGKYDALQNEWYKDSVALFPSVGKKESA